MRHLARGVLLVVLLLALASTASAECSWVFWVKRDYDAALEGEWTVLQARATRQDCIAAKLSNVARSSASLDDEP